MLRNQFWDLIPDLKLWPIGLMVTHGSFKHKINLLLFNPVTQIRLMLQSTQVVSKHNSPVGTLSILAIKQVFMTAYKKDTLWLECTVKFNVCSLRENITGFTERQGWRRLGGGGQI